MTNLKKGTINRFALTGALFTRLAAVNRFLPSFLFKIGIYAVFTDPSFYSSGFVASHVMLLAGMFMEQQLSFME
jgi:hypothetical protein